MEKAFDEFLSHEAYDAAQEAIFRLVRTAFIAGWQAAKRDTEATAAIPTLMRLSVSLPDQN